MDESYLHDGTVGVVWLEVAVDQRYRYLISIVQVQASGVTMWGARVLRLRCGVLGSSKSALSIPAFGWRGKGSGVRVLG